MTDIRVLRLKAEHTVKGYTIRKVEWHFENAVNRA